jgi:hypothetical protein
MPYYEPPDRDRLWWEAIGRAAKQEAARMAARVPKNAPTGPDRRMEAHRRLQRWRERHMNRRYRHHAGHVNRILNSCTRAVQTTYGQTLDVWERDLVYTLLSRITQEDEPACPFHRIARSQRDRHIRITPLNYDRFTPEVFLTVVMSRDLSRLLGFQIGIWASAPQPALSPGPRWCYFQFSYPIGRECDVLLHILEWTYYGPGSQRVANDPIPYTWNRLGQLKDSLTRNFGAPL